MVKKDLWKILLASDFSVGSMAALKTLKTIQKKYKTDVSLIHVNSYWDNFFSNGVCQKEATQRLQSWQKKISKSHKEKNIFSKIGNPADSILFTASKIKANLILMGSKSTGESGRYKTGATIESVVRFAKIPVWVSQRDKISKILCGVDGSPTSAKALQFAIDLARRFSAKLCIIHALPNYMHAFGDSKRTRKYHDEKFKIENTKKIEKFLNTFDFNKVKHEILIQWGEPSNIILDRAEDYHFDLIVLGATGHSILYHMLIGSTTERILRYSPCSLLVVR